MRYFYLLFFLFFPSFLFAYLDPGTGSLLLYALVGIGTSLWFLLRGVFYQLSSLLFARNNIRTKNKYGIVFYSEGAKYWQVFYPVIEQLLSQKIACTYITCEKDDPAFQLQNADFTALCPGTEMFTIAFMNKIEADIVVSTTPHLDVYMWKRSKKVKKYIHIFHAPTGVDFYEKYALSFYDIIFSVGEFIENAQKYLDKVRGLPDKTYYNVGCTYYDYMHEKLQTLKRTTKDKTILYAPTWGLKRSSFFTNGIPIMQRLLDAGFRVIFRPHPQFFVSHKKELENFKNQFSHYKTLTIDIAASPLQAMIDSDILISDFSGIVFDFAYLFERPVFLTLPPSSVKGYEAEELPADIQWDIPATQQIAHELSENEINHIDDYISDVLKQEQNYKNRIAEFKKNIFNFCTAGPSAARAISDIHTSLRTSL